LKPAFLEIQVKTGTGTYDLQAGVRRIGDDLLVAVWGGEKPHIGAVAVAQSRPSLKNPEARSATASVICFPAHKEDEMARAMSQVLAAALDTKVVVTAGMHWDNIGQEGIRKVMENSEALVDLILQAVLAQPPRHKALGF
jgi:hypothetical protein